MFKKHVPFLFVLFLLPGLSWSDSSAPAAAAPILSLPSAIHATLDAEYPGWTLAPVTTQIQKEFRKHHVNRPPSLAVGDFNHDKKRDYAVQITLTTPGQEEQIIIIFLAADTGYEETILQSMGIDPTSYLWVSHQDTLMVLGGPAGDTAYAYEDGKFREATVDQDPDHPDPSIPRPEDSHE